MTRLIGSLNGPDGPLNGRLHLKPSTPFIGAPAGGLSFKVENGFVDIEVPPNAPSTVWLAGWRGRFEQEALQFTERWVIPNVEEISLDEVRWAVAPRRQTRAARGAAADHAMLQSELGVAQQKIAQLEHENARLLMQVSSAEGRAVAASGKLASLNSELARLRQKIAAAPAAIEERVVERAILSDEAKALWAPLKQEMQALRDENAALKEQIQESISLSTHFANLHAEIDRLNLEKQQLSSRVEELKQPQRSSSSLRQELIANLDRLIDG